MEKLESVLTIHNSHISEKGLSIATRPPLMTLGRRLRSQGPADRLMRVIVEI